MCVWNAEISSRVSTRRLSRAANREDLSGLVLRAVTRFVIYMPLWCLDWAGWRDCDNFASILTLIARFMGPTWGPPGADRTQLGPMWATWTLLSGEAWKYKTRRCLSLNACCHICRGVFEINNVVQLDNFHFTLLRNYQFEVAKCALTIYD